MKQIKAYITLTLTQMLFVGYGYAQFTNQLNITPNKVKKRIIFVHNNKKRVKK